MLKQEGQRFNIGAGDFESYNVNSYSFGVGTGSVFLNGTGGVNNTGGSLLPSFLGLSFTLPTYLTAYGSQSSTTFSAISPASVVIASGEAASLSALAGLSRDTSSANSALTRQFTEARRADIAQDFAAARQLVTEVSTFFANRAAEEKKAEDAAKALGVRQNADGTYPRDPTTGKLIAVNPAAQPFIDTAADIRKDFGSGSAARLIATAISGAAGGNVTGSLGSFVQAAAVGVLQGLAVREVKAIADTFLRKGVPTATSEAVRTALQGLVGCAGAAPTGNCASGALGAASSVVLNNLITSLLQPEERDPVTGAVIPRSLADQQARTALIATLTGAIAGALGANAGVASNAGVIETENNALARARQPRPTPIQNAVYSECVYDLSCTSANGDTKVDPREFGLMPTDLELPNGLRAAIFRRGEITIVAFAGTNQAVADNIANVAVALGITSEQYEAALTVARRVDDTLGRSRRLEFTGHSLGGGLAAVAAAVTDRRGTTFNAAPISIINAQRYNITPTRSNRIVNIYVRGDPVSGLSYLPTLSATAYLPPFRAVGRQHPLGPLILIPLGFLPITQLFGNPHSLNTVIGLLQRRPMR